MPLAVAAASIFKCLSRTNPIKEFKVSVMRWI